MWSSSKCCGTPERPSRLSCLVVGGLLALCAGRSTTPSMVPPVSGHVDVYWGVIKSGGHLRIFRVVKESNGSVVDSVTVLMCDDGNTLSVFTEQLSGFVSTDRSSRSRGDKRGD